MAHRVRVGTYNLYLGADLSLVLGDRTPEELRRNAEVVRRQLEATAFPDRVDALARVIARQRLDLLGVQELCIWRVDGELLWDYTALLLDALGRQGAPYELVADLPTFRGQGALDGEGTAVELALEGRNAILRRRDSAVAVVEATVGVFEGAFTTSVLGGRQITLTRGWCAAHCAVEGGTQAGFRFAVTHTEAYDEEARNRQRDELVTALSDGREPLAVVGDFNATPDTVAMPDGLVDAWTAAGHLTDDPRGRTFGHAGDLRNEECTMRERIDYVWVRGMEVTGCRTFGVAPGDRSASGLWPSDHAGVAADLRF